MTDIVTTEPSPERQIKKSAPLTPKWEAEARERARAAVKKYQKPLDELVKRDANEGDTRLLVTDILCDALGYDKYEDLTTEYQVKVDFADYGVRIDKQLVAFIEVKRCAQSLNQKHLHQVQSYAVNEGVEWMILTNGRNWQLWHMTPGLPVIMDMVLDIDLLSAETTAKKGDALFYLSRDSFKKKVVDQLWKQRAATSAKAITKVITSAKMVEELRKELRRQSGFNVDAKQIQDTLRDEILRPEVQ
jgi:predicted type IV restriction endonuclease